ncbi:MAG: pitrilysin family protein [Spirochaetales bacterium]|nr:pitrilysin family protein [Spirochaetales bacterium]
MNLNRNISKLILGLIVSLMMTGLSALAQGEAPQSQGAEIVSLTLDNGIPLFVQPSDTSRVQSVKVFFKGHAQFAEPGQDGLEKLTLKLMERGSENYSWEEVQAMEREKSASVGGTTKHFDYSGFYLKTLDKYFDETYPLFVDELLRPSWDEEEFEKVKNSLLMARTQKEADPYSLASQILNDSFFGDHAYQTDIDGNLETLEGITLDEVKAYYGRILDGNRMFFVAVGDFDPEALRDRLNEDFGSLPINRKAIIPVGSLGAIEEDVLVEPFADSPGLAYVRGDWVIPEISPEEKAALQLGLSLLDDILFQVVRTENSACYSVWSHLYDFQAKYASFGIYKTQVPYDVDELVLEAVDILASGRCMSTAAVGDDPYVSIEESLEFYKAQFVTEYYSDQQTNNVIAEQIGRSWLYEGDPAAYRGQSELWNAVTAEEIVEVIKKYVVGQPIKWIVLGGEDVI